MSRFTIRDLLWLMVVVAVFAGWWADKQKYLRWIKSLETRINLLEGR